MDKHLPTAPKYLSKEAKAWWRKIVSSWELTDDSLLVLENAMAAFVRLRQAQAILKEEGIIVRDRFDQPKQHPATIIERDCKATLLRHLEVLGLDLEPIQGIGRPPTAHLKIRGA